MDDFPDPLLPINRTFFFRLRVSISETSALLLVFQELCSVKCSSIVQEAQYSSRMQAGYESRSRSKDDAHDTKLYRIITRSEYISQGAVLCPVHHPDCPIRPPSPCHPYTTKTLLLDSLRLLQELGSRVNLLLAATSLPIIRVLDRTDSDTRHRKKHTSLSILPTPYLMLELYVL